MDDTLVQLVLLILIGVGWVIKQVAEQRKRRELEQQPAPSPEVIPPPAIEPTPTANRRPFAPPLLSTQPSRIGSRRPHLSETAGDATVTPRTITRAEQAADRRDQSLRTLSGGCLPDSVRHATQAGVLWSEVLGPCRAVRGPHVPPTFSRIRS